jgi:hypothetical protein
MGYAKMRRADHAKTANALPFPDHPFAGGKRGYQSVSMVQVTAKRHFAAEDQNNIAVQNGRRTATRLRFAL